MWLDLHPIRFPRGLARGPRSRTPSPPVSPTEETMHRIAASLAFAAASLPAIALAHPGHGSTDGHGLIHYLVEPVHASVLVGLLAAAVVSFVAVKRRERAARSSR
jgi:hypothetical protein